MSDSETIPVAAPLLKGNELKYVTDAIKEGWISSKGQYITRFEEEFAKFCGVKYSCSCNNGTTALHLAVCALGIGLGDEVIVPALTYIATANVVRYVEATPVFVDVDEDTWNINAKKIEEKITSHTKAIMVVHIYGIPSNMEEILALAKKYNLKVIEDCAEAVGAEYKNQKVGSIGDIGCFSFFGNKVITTGEGGMCVTNDLKLHEKMSILKNQGMSPTRRYWHEEIGFNYRMTNLQAAIGLAQLEMIDEFLKKREQDEEEYRKLLENNASVSFSPRPLNAKCIYWMHCLLSEKRDEIIKLLDENKIETRPFFNVLNSMPPYKTSEKFPIAEKLSRIGINLPSSVKLSKENIKFICALINTIK